MKNLYVSDLDGTLLTDDAILTDYSRIKLTAMLNAGLNFTVASARSVSTIRKIMKDIPIKLPVIEFNGAFISDIKTGEHEIINEIDKDIILDIDSLIKTYELEAFYSTFDGKDDHLYYGKVLNKGMDWYVQDRLKAKDKRLSVLENQDISHHNIICYTVIDKMDRLKEIHSELSERFSHMVETHLMENLYSPGWYWLTIHDRKATKDQAIISLMDKYNLSSKELTVFGDNLNDTKMFNLAKHKIAVANGKEELKRIATEVIGSNNEDSVIKYILNKEM